MKQYFDQQLEGGATETFFYGLESLEHQTINIMRHKGSLDTFPNLEFVRMFSESIPLFREHFGIEE